jgi:predicted  nucleic acid-binding Zn-ribbon protein
MEKVRVQCAACGAAFATGAEHAGKSGKCPKCGGAVQVPAARSAPAAKPGWDSEEPEELDDSDADVVIRDRPSARREEPA